VTNSQKNDSNASFFYTFKSVLWAMLGVRGNKGYEDDVQKIKPAHAILIGIIAVALFILILATVVSMVIGQVSGG